MFLGFANFYFCFIRGFSKIAGPLTSMLKTSSPSPSENFSNKIVEDNKVVDRNNDSSKNLAKSKKSKNYRISAKSRKSNYLSKLSKFKKTILDKSKILVNLTMATNAGAIGYLTVEARVTFTQLRQAFIEAPILQYFD